MTREQMQQIRDALVAAAPTASDAVWRKPLDALRILDAALAAPEQEPVAWIFKNRLVELVDTGSCVTTLTKHEACRLDVALYTAPVVAPQREWQDLTDVEIYKCSAESASRGTVHYARAIEAALKEKNHGR